MYLIFQWCWLQVTKAIEFHITHLFFLQPTEYFSKKYTKNQSDASGVSPLPALEAADLC